MPETRTEYWNRIQGLRSGNAHIKDAVAYFDEHYEETDEVIRRFIEGSKLTNEEFITFIAIRRLEGLRRSSGNASSAMMDQIRREYKNTPWKFVEEFLQNADDCSYDGTPEIQIIVDERKSAIEFIYNERGFTRNDIWALTQFSDSTKPSSKDLTVRAQENGLFYNEKTGRKGIGFKSVFSLDAQNVIVHICSNGFGFKLDNDISSIVPVWENPGADDEKTHIRIELVNPNFSLQDIYPQFKNLFCVSNRRRLFSDSPILFMHKLRAVRVEHRNNRGAESFAVSLNQIQSQTKYGSVICEENGILSGIAYNGKLCSSELTHINLTFQENGGALTEVPCLRYSETIKVNGCWNVFSVISPVIQGKYTWEGGSLFRTFPMIDHSYPIPFAMNLPFELNMARKGISYNDAIAENGFISKEMFKVGGVFRKFLSYLKTCEGVSIDQYFSDSPAILFDDTNNRNRDSYYVPLVDLQKILSEEDLFPLYKTERKYVSLNNLACVDEQFLDWPEPQKMLELLLGVSFVDRLVSRKYLSCDLLKSKRTGIIDAQFVVHMNEYLRILDKKYGCASKDFSSFMSASFYPFLCKNETAIIRCDGFRRLEMYVFEVFDGSNTTVLRENFKADTIWMDGTSKPSYRRYRTVTSSQTDLSLLIKRHQPISVQKTTEIFAASAIQRRASIAIRLDEILNEIEEATYYGCNLNGITFTALNDFALAAEICDEINPFRDACLLDIISRSDANRIAKSFNVSLGEVLKIARSLGLREADDFFDEIGTFWQFNSLSKKFLGIDNETNAKGFLKLLDKKLAQGKRKLDVTYDEIRNASTSIKLFLMRKPEYIVREAYDQLCTGILNDVAIWHKKCNESTELLLRAVSKVTSINVQCFEYISIDIKYLVENRLGTYAKRATEKFNFDKYLRIVNNGFFEKVSKQEVTDALMATELDEARKKEEAAKTFYRGDLSTCQSDGKAIEFLLDTLSNAVYLHGTAERDFREAFIYKYLQCRFDAEKNKLLDQVRKQTRPVYEQRIRPMLDRTNDDWDAAFDLLAQEFGRISKEDIINIIARFRLQSYSESLGHASQSHENEITDDYRQEPWKFAYEFLQNTDDCLFPANVIPEIAVAVSRRNNSISFEYNENGFTQDDINAITSFGNSQKASDLAPLDSLPRTGVFDREKTGRKGRGFKSVFALPGKDIVVHILSNGFSFRFEKRLGEIIPIWEEPEFSTCMGTRITIEGFLDNSINTIYERLLDTLFVKDQEMLFSASPLLFLRNLRRISLSDGMKTHRFEIEEEKVVYSAGNFQTSNIIVSGVRENELYKESQIAQLIIHQYNATNEPIHVKALKASYMKNVGGRTRVISIMTPVLTASSHVRFTLGSLYRTLPMDHHKLPVPIAINTAFNLNSGRNALVDEQNQLNVDLNRLVFEECLPKTLILLRDIPNIAIDAYIPSSSSALNTLYNGMLHVNRVDIRRTIRSIPLLRLCSGKDFVSCDKASVLSADCYTWPLPVRLAQIFDNTINDNLVLQKYRSKIDDLHNVQIVNFRFCDNLNKYLDAIESTGQSEVWAFLSDKLYAYISQHYDDLKRSYVGKEEALRSMQIFAYTDVNNQSHRENGNEDNIWLVNCPAKYKSYIVCRVFESAPVHYNLNRDKWIVDLLSAVDFKEFRAGDGYETDTWDKSMLWLKIGLYYERITDSHLTYLDNCALCETFSPEENIFRRAYLRSADKEILQRIISEQDVAGIVRELNLVTTVQQIDVVNAIKRRGLRKEDDFFESSLEYIKLSKPTLAVFRSAGFDRIASQEYVQTVVKAFDTRYHNASLFVSFAELKKCSPVIFTCIFRLGLLSGENRSRIAQCFFEEIEIQHSDKAADYVEAYLCCMCFAKEQLSITRKLSISITEIKRRKLGECVQRAQFNRFCSGSTLTVSRDIRCEAYESREIKRSLHWLSGDADAETEIMKYSYYTADISDAFAKSETSQYIFDNSTVIVNSQNPQEYILDFVKHKYTAAGDKELLVGLIKIASKQYELQENWHGTKKEFITKLAAFRTETDKYINFLCPGYQRGINEATGDTAGSLIPELLQNINDCRGGDKSTRSLTITMDNQKNTMTLTYDERGFQFADVYSITAYGQSTKHDEREGEKGLGFKKVFTVFSQVEIYSNGFSFRLSDTRPTIPQWIEPNNSNAHLIQSGKTTMVFTFAVPERTAQPIHSIWANAMRDIENASLLLGLRNISEYHFSSIDGTQALTRNQILQKFYYKDLPLIETYRQLHSGAAPDSLTVLKENLRTRKKCVVMSNAEFERYLQQLTVAVYVPRKIGGNGLYYSTLPTAKVSGCSMFIDVPLELSTGRNEIMVDSRFNHTIMRMLYYPDGARCSVMSHLLSCIAKENSDCRLYEYIPNVDAYLSAIAGDSIEGKKAIRGELFNLPIVHIQNQTTLLPVSRIFTAPRIVYDYMHNVKESITQYDTWLRSNHSESVPAGNTLASYNDGTRTALSHFALNVGASTNHYPLGGLENEYVIQYFETEYGTEGGE